MTKIVILAEKPSQAKAYADSFQSKQKIAGGFAIKDELFTADVIITYAYGHLVELQNPEYYTADWKKWQLQQLPMFPERYQFKVTADKRAHFKQVKSYLDEADQIIIATDSDREGENIARSIIEVSGNAQKPTQRLWINSLESDEIRKGFATLRPGADYYSAYIEAQTRQISDWLVGMNISRLYTLLLQKKGLTGVFSIGRVQTPTLFLIWQRQQEIAEFKPETYYEAYLEVEAEHGHYRAKHKQQFKSLADLRAYFKKGNISYQTEQPARVTKLETKQKQVASPQLYSLSDLQSHANRLYKISPASTLKIVQTLYERKLVSYPRTDCHFITPAEFNYLKSGLSDYCNIEQVEISDPRLNANKRYVDAAKVQEHYAIIPTKKKLSAASLAKLGNFEKKLYHLIVKRTIAMFAPPYVYDETTVETSVETEPFKTIGRTVKQRGWKAILATTTPKVKKDDLPALPKLQLHEQVAATLVDKACETKAPPVYTEGTLITAMKTIGKGSEAEAKKILKAIEGIGTEATRANILETLKRQEYIEVNASQIRVTDKGCVLCENIKDVEISSAEMTAKWEGYLKKIHDGTGTQAAFLGSIQRFIEHLIAVVPQQLATAQIDVTAESQAIGTCPTCGKAVLEKFKVFGCESCDFVIFKKILNKKISRTMCVKLLKTRKTNLLKGFISKNGKKFNASLRLDDENKVAFKFIPFTKAK
ncbi:DNA topoisomerase III [Brochothrix campestris]|uniref:type IA DNA topoisomerase n=1 Tax=Brochothrix campestris TaxID=2757 RepID=UPI0038D04ACE